MIAFSRNIHFDSLKFILIFLVVFGHSMEYLGDESKITNAMYSFIYTFHMPLFVFISGYFTNVSKAYSSSLKILEVFIVLQLFSSFLDNGITLLSMLIPKWTLWYLVSLSFWRLLIGVLNKYIISNKFLAIAITILMALLVGFIPIQNGLSFQRTFYFMPFFILGYICKHTGWYEKARAIGINVALTILSIAFILLYVNGTNIGKVFYGTTLYNLNNNIPIQILSKALMLLVSFMTSVCVVNCIPKLNNLSKYGAITLFIYAYHTYVIKAIRYFLNGESHFVVVFIISCFIVFILLMLSKIKFLSMILNPFSNLVQFGERFKNNSPNHKY